MLDGWQKALVGGGERDRVGVEVEVAMTVSAENALVRLVEDEDHVQTADVIANGPTSSPGQSSLGMLGCSSWDASIGAGTAQSCVVPTSTTYVLYPH